MFNKYIENKVEYKPYDNRFPEVFNKIKLLLSEHLSDVKISHYGSSAIKGLGGKGIIDLFIQTRRENIGEVIITLEEIGFHYPAFRTRPFPEDRPMRAGSIKVENTVYNIHAQ